MPSINIEVYCSKCGKGLCQVTRVDGNSISVEPCDNCLEEAQNNIRDELQDKIDQLEEEKIEIERRIK